MWTRRTLLGAGTAAVAGPLIARNVAAQVIEKPAKMLVGFPPGGAADLVARLLVAQMKSYAPSLIVDNKAGAGGRIALEAAKNSAPDGATMILTPASMLAVYPHVFKSLPYDALVDFVPISTVCEITLALVVGPKAPAGIKTLADLLAWYKVEPKEAALGYVAQGSTQHFAAILLAQGSGIAFTEVPYKGGGPAIQDLVAGQIPASITVPSTILAHAAAGRVRVLATTGSKRDAALPDVATFQEQGYKDIVMEEWFGVLVPARTPEPIVAKLSAAVVEAARSKEVLDGLAKAGLSPSSATPAEFAARLRADHTRWAGIVKATGYKPED